jgi:hypothetical protein
MDIFLPVRLRTPLFTHTLGTLFFYWVRISEIRSSICFKAFWAFSLVQVFWIEALALILVPSTKRVLPSIRLSWIHILAHCFKTLAKASLFFLLYSAIVLWSGFRPFDFIQYFLIFYLR